MYALIIITLVFCGCAKIVPIQENLIQNVSECNSSNVQQFMNQTFAIIDANTTACQYQFLGYGGANDRNISVQTAHGVVHSSVFFSGVGSGGHGYTTYCVAATNPIEFQTAVQHMCNSLTYKLADFSCQNISDISQPFVDACNAGLFTVVVNQTNVFSVTQRVSRCASFVEVGTYDCTTTFVNTTNMAQQIGQLVQNAK